MAKNAAEALDLHEPPLPVQKQFTEYRNNLNKEDDDDEEDQIKITMKTEKTIDTGNSAAPANDDDDTDDNNNGGEEDDDDDEIIVGLTNFNLDPSSASAQPSGDTYLSRAPIYRRNEVNVRAAPYKMEAPRLTKSQQSSLPKALPIQPPPSLLSSSLLEDQSIEDFLASFDDNFFESAANLLNIQDIDVPEIPMLPATDVYDVKQKTFQPTEVDPKFAGKDISLPEPRLLVKQTGGAAFIVLPVVVRLSADVSRRRFGIHLPTIFLPSCTELRKVAGRPANNNMKVELLFQPNPNDGRVVSSEVDVVNMRNSSGLNVHSVQEQFVELAPFILNGRPVLSALLEGVTQDVLNNAVGAVAKKDRSELLKEFGPESLTYLMSFCTRDGEDLATRAQVFAICARILSDTDPKVRANLVVKTASKLSALDLAAMTNNWRAAVFLAETYFLLGHDVYQRDRLDNTIFHMIVRKGDIVASSLEALLALRFRNGDRVYSTDVKSVKGYTPMHIAAFGRAKAAHHLIRILHAHDPGCMVAKTDDGSTPLLLACQRALDPDLLATLIFYTPPGIINDRRNDGFTPILMVASRSDAEDLKAGIFPLNETDQIRMLKMLLDNGADSTITVEGFSAAKLLNQTGRRNACNCIMQYQKKVVTSEQMASIGSSGATPKGFVPLTETFGWQMSPPSSNITATDESEEEFELEAIASALIDHPSIQAAIDEATNMNKHC